MIAQALRLHETTILRHLNDFLEGKINTENGGSSSHLAEQQIFKCSKDFKEAIFNVFEKTVPTMADK